MFVKRIDIMISLVFLLLVGGHIYHDVSAFLPHQGKHAPHTIFPTAFRYPNFLNHPKLNIIGDARTEVTELVIAGPGRRQTGAVWFAQTFDISDGFFAEFSVSISHVDNRGGEGIAFVVQKDGEYALG